MYQTTGAALAARTCLRRVGCAGRVTTRCCGLAGAQHPAAAARQCWTGLPSGIALSAGAHGTAARCTLPAPLSHPGRLAAGAGGPRCLRAAAKRLTACHLGVRNRHVGHAPDRQLTLRNARPVATMPTTQCTASRRCTSTLHFLEARAGGALHQPMLHLPPCVSRRRFISRSWRSWIACQQIWTTSWANATTTAQ